MTERRYDEEEVRRIFDEAARAYTESSAASEANSGLSLEDLKRIGGEVGLPPARIEAAARDLDFAESQPDVERDLGMPVSVGRTAALAREPSDDEWAQLVALARRTFAAKGEVDPTGRYWANGNLSMSVEPGVDGHRIVLRTTKGDGRLLNRIGLGAMAIGAPLGLFGLLAGDTHAAGLFLGAFGGYGLLSFAINALRLPRWAGRREEQFELITSRARDLLSAPARDT